VSCGPLFLRAARLQIRLAQHVGTAERAIVVSGNQRVRCHNGHHTTRAGAPSGMTARLRRRQTVKPPAIPPRIFKKWETT
jgi:hypothetical protein